MSASRLWAKSWRSAAVIGLDNISIQAKPIISFRPSMFRISSSRSVVVGIQLQFRAGVSGHLMRDQERTLCDKVKNERTEHCGANHDDWVTERV